jgi:hypothetical protein
MELDQYHVLGSLNTRNAGSDSDRNMGASLGVLYAVLYGRPPKGRLSMQ